MSNPDSLAIASVKSTLASLVAYLQTTPQYAQLVASLNTNARVNTPISNTLYNQILASVASLFTLSQNYLNHVYGVGTFSNAFNQSIKNTVQWDANASTYVAGSSLPQLALMLGDSTITGFVELIVTSCSGEDLTGNVSDWGNDMVSPYGGLIAPKAVSILAKPLLNAVTSDEQVITTGFGFDPQADICMDQFAAVANIQSACFDNEPLGFLYVAIYQIGVPACNPAPTCYAPVPCSGLF